MGCGKSKHAIETATTVIKSTKPDGGKETQITTKTVTEKGDASLVQVETKSLVDEDTKKETTTTKVDTVANTEVVKDDDEKVKDTNDATTENVVPTSSKDDAGPTKEEEKKETVVNEDEEKKENEVKVENVPPIGVVETKESNVTKDSNVKMEFMTPRTGEDVVEAVEVVKDDAEVKGSKEENIESVISSDTSAKTIDDTSPKVEEQNVVADVESAQVKPTEEEGVKLTKADPANAESSVATEPEKVSRLNEANVAETPEEKP